MEFEMKNYIGQLRIYSLLDLIVLSATINANMQEIFGIVFLHIAFLLFLEKKHAHIYRKSFPEHSWIPLIVVGIMLYGHYFESIAYIFFSFLYTTKNKKYMGVFSPLFRGLQYYFIVAGITGYSVLFPFIVGIVIFFRNLAGDYRDIEKDKREGILTIPHCLGFKKDIDVYLIFLLSSTTIWWYFSKIPFLVLVIILITQIAVYKLTPR